MILKYDKNTRTSLLIFKNTLVGAITNLREILGKTKKSFEKLKLF